MGEHAKHGKTFSIPCNEENQLLMSFSAMTCVCYFPAFPAIA